MDWPAPAKLNLFLHVLGRAPDGYHDLQTLFVFLDLVDTLQFGPREDAQVQRVSALAEVSSEEDLCVRAARALNQLAGTRHGVDIVLHKRIPMGAGFGGGSSDCATTLVALNKIWDLGLDIDTLAEVGLTLGSDVPVFVRGLSAFAEGRGERLTPVSIQVPWFVLVTPDCHVSTAQIFQHPALTRNSPPMKISDCLEAGSVDSQDIELKSLLSRTRNDCETMVSGLFAPVRDALDWLNQHAAARMTGTGAAVFAPFANREAAEVCRADAPSGWRVQVARGCSRSPLLERMKGTTND